MANGPHRETIQKSPSLVSKLSLEDRQRTGTLAKNLVKLTIFKCELTYYTMDFPDSFAIKTSSEWGFMKALTSESSTELKTPNVKHRA